MIFKLSKYWRLEINWIKGIGLGFQIVANENALDFIYFPFPFFYISINKISKELYEALEGKK